MSLVLFTVDFVLVPTAATDHFDAVVPHLNGRDITLVCASIAPLRELRDYKRQMGWRFPWVSSLGSDFNYDFGVAFTEHQRRNGADYNFRHVDEPEPQKEGMSVFASQMSPGGTGDGGRRLRHAWHWFGSSCASKGLSPCSTR
jgi:predicted dithiol-disulfide oxidoreductase (DUF899 family)